MDSEESRRQWAMFSHQRLQELAGFAWTTLRDQLQHEVNDFNDRLEQETGNRPISFSSGNRSITVRKTQFPSHILRVLSRLDRDQFLAEVEAASDGKTAPKTASERIALEFKSDGNLYLVFREEKRTAYEIANLLAEDIFKTFVR